MTCDQLWVARNSIYKARGYCFKTERAIQHFGNGGCIYQNESDIPFTQAERTPDRSVRCAGAGARMSVMEGRHISWPERVDTIMVIGRMSPFGQSHRPQVQ